MTGGTHKCPLCAATFTRPQHVGRHLRSHTGDRPYECKECPLKFARSDLLARHVGKAHRPADGSEPPKTTKKGRRKSMPTSVHPSHEDQAESSSAANLSTVPSGQGTMPQRADVKPRRASSGHQVPGPFAPINQTAYFNTAVSPSNNEPQPPPQLQAQRMYPHHPLLAGTPQPPQLQQQQSWLGGQGLGTITASSPPSFFNPFNQGPNTAGPATALPYNPALASQSPYAGVPMRISGSDQSTGSGGSLSMGRSGSSSYGYEFGWKKRACDQCNQSKVRCDSQEPCQRCSQRNIRCSYNKPTKSRSMVAYSTPKFALPLSAGPSSMSFAGSAGSSAHQSASPVSHFSSPLSNGNPSPVTATMNQPLPPVAPSMPVGQPILQGQGQWTIPEPVAGSVPTRAPLSSAIPSQSTLPNQWQNGLQQRSQRASSTASYTSPLANVVPIPSQTSVPTVVPSARRTSSGGSSLQYLAPTPSLTTSTSPSSSEEPSERRVSHGSQMSGTYVFNPMGGSFDLGPKNEMANVPSQDLNGYNMPQSFSPTSVEAMVANALPSTTTFQPDYSQFAWSVPSTANTVGTMGSVNSIGSVGPLATGTIDPRGSLRKSQDPVNFSEDEDNGPTVSRPASSAASAFGSTNFSMVDENGNPLLVEAAQRRMSSTGVWASAFNQMSLQDRNAGVVDPYTASQVASQLQAKRPSYPVLHPGQTALHPHGTFFDPNAAPNGAGQKAPSLRDVKDLWKLFMSEPMTNQGSQGQAQSELHTQSVSQQQVLDKEQPASSRPAMGQRGLSRSNSMPELLSPVANGQMFFSNFLNGATPRPTEPQSSYMLQQKPVGGTSISPEDIAVKNENDSDGQITMGKGGDENLRQWKDQIKNRQASFYFDPKVNGRFGPGSQNMVPNGNHMHSAGLVMGMGMDSSSQNPGMAFDASMPGGFSRPLASVFQYNPALQQTLAPERAISFGMDGMPTPTPARTNFAATNYLSARSTQPAANGLNNSPARGSNGMPMPTKKVTSLLARPGNKRLASQTLVPDAGKKLGYWDDGDDSSPFDGDVEDADDDGGLLGKRAVQGSGLGTLGGGGYYGIPS